MAQKLVTLLTPCYNMENYIHRLLDSVLEQSYPKIEMIVVDDGSTDKSAQIIKEYISKFENRGYMLRYAYQQNAGQSVAIQNGLKEVRGDYLAWPDADDYYASTFAIQRMVDALENASSEFAMVRTMEREVDEHSLKELCIYGANAREQENLSLFEDCLFQQNGFYFCSGAYMVRFAVLRELTNLCIYTEKNAGQNWQLLLPVLYSYRCLTIKEPLYCVLNRASSHSRGRYVGYEGLITRYDSYAATLQGTLDLLKNMPENIRQKYKQMVNEKYLRLKMTVALDYNKRKDYASYYAALPSTSLTKKDRVLYFCCIFHIDHIVRRVYCRIIRAIR